MIPWPQQIKIAAEALPILKEYGLVYLAMEERTGKSLTAILMYEECDVQNILISTTKKAMPGWQKTLAEFKHTKNYTLINHHSILKVLRKGGYDAVILDEAHKNISGYPIPKTIWKNTFKLVYGLPIIYCSATPYAQGPQLLFHQLALSKWSPWRRFQDFYAWYQFYADRDKEGMVRVKRINAHTTAVDYTAVMIDKVIASVKHLFVTYTRKELGFEQEPEDKLHYIQLSDRIKKIYNVIVEDKVLDFTLNDTGKEYSLVCDSAIKMRWALHMLEGGSLKIDDESISLGNNEKADYVLDTWGDTNDLVIMYHYKADYIKLSEMFANATLLQATAYAEGVDLSMYKTLVVYSMGFSTAQHSQRRARQANMYRKDPIHVHFLLVKGAVSDKIYKTVAKNKKNFVDTVFERI